MLDDFLWEGMQTNILAINNRFFLKTCAEEEMNGKVRFSRDTIFLFIFVALEAKLPRISGA